MDSSPVLKRQPKGNMRSRGSSSPFRSPQKHLLPIPEDSVFESSRSTPILRKASSSSMIGVKRGSHRDLSPLDVSLESYSGEDYLCRSPPRAAPSPPCITPEPSTPTSPLTPMAFSNSSPSSPAHIFTFSPPPSPTSSDSTYSGPSTPHAVEYLLTLPPKDSEEAEEECEDEFEFYTKNLSSLIRIQAPSTPVSATKSARPESFVLPRGAKSTRVGPNDTLDPTYPRSQKKLRRSAVVIPTYPPPPVPPLPSPPVSAPVGRSRSPAFVINRPPPRTSLPTDLDEFEMSWFADESERPQEKDDRLQAIIKDLDSLNSAPKEGANQSDFTLSLPHIPEPTGRFETRFWDKVEEHQAMVGQDDEERLPHLSWPVPPKSISPPPRSSSLAPKKEDDVNSLSAIAPFLDYEDHETLLPYSSSLNLDLDLKEQQQPSQPSRVLKSRFSTSTLGSVSLPATISTSPSSSPSKNNKWKGGKLRLSLRRGSVSFSTKSSTSPTSATSPSSSYPSADSSASFWVTSPPPFPVTPPRKRHRHRNSQHSSLHRRQRTSIATTASPNRTSFAFSYLSGSESGSETCRSGDLLCMSEEDEADRDFEEGLRRKPIPLEVVLAA
ncbi:hypothetical protein DL96DRAFT_1551327 [Flagelloscypha sp. PMI_526]|nr:hypothetical protein DL96DRAFT_1551327 [Flagelloscypha sp. PMI_526]